MKETDTMISVAGRKESMGSWSAREESAQRQGHWASMNAAEK